MEHRIPGSQSQADLPMVVYLRGDEEYIEDFEVDADKAMEFLNIKRSRLTQISGRELRVGRIRKDRYVRPVYRAQDLEDYKTWTRATATSQSSSKAMEKAIQSLSGQWDEFKLESQFVFKDLVSEIRRESLEELLHQRRLQGQQFKRLLREIEGTQNSLEQHSLNLKSQWASNYDDSIAKLESLVNDLGTVKMIIESLHLDVHSLTQAIKAHDERLKKQAKKIENLKEGLEVGIENTLDVIDGLGDKVERLGKRIEQTKDTQQTESLNIRSTRSRKRRSLVRYSRKSLALT